MTTKRYYYEVSVSVNGGAPDKSNPFNLGDRCSWVRKGEPRDTYHAAMQDAIANGERPYRVKSEAVWVAPEVEQQVA